MILRVPHLVHAMSKLAARSHVGKNHVAVVGKQRLCELVAFPRLPRNVKFKYQEPHSLSNNHTILLMPRFHDAPARAPP